VARNPAFPADGDWRCIGVAPVSKSAKVAHNPDRIHCLLLLVRHLFRLEINDRVRDRGRGRPRGFGFPMENVIDHGNS
jgi:hypothetical protein